MVKEEKGKKGGRRTMILVKGLKKCVMLSCVISANDKVSQYKNYVFNNITKLML
jgi:hypothetical protein